MTRQGEAVSKMLISDGLDSRVLRDILRRKKGIKHWELDDDCDCSDPRLPPHERCVMSAIISTGRTKFEINKSKML